MTARKIFKGKRVLFPDGHVRAAAIVVQFGRIQSLQDYDYPAPFDVDEVVDAGDLLLMPGVVDSHVHVNEPGRTHWEGYHTATRAAAAGGITTIVDMPLNSIPATVSVDALNTKLQAAQGQCFVDVGFWGGVIPNNELCLRPMLRAGACGFKCFLVNSGVDEFPMVTEKDLHEAMKQLQGTGAVLLFHAELECGCSGPASKGGSSEYNIFLESRPEEMEIEAIKLVCRLSQQYQVRCHIVHLSAASALPIIQQARAAGTPVTVETTHHYLYLDAAAVPQGATQYKCVPPIRSKHNQEKLWEGVKTGAIDLVISDHSPCPADLKLMDSGDFLGAWGGIASVQFGLSLLWTNAKANGLGLADIQRLLCSNPASLAGLTGKGTIKVGNDADFVIWDTEATYKVTEDNIHHKHKITPYLGAELRGVVHRTVVRGVTVYKDNIVSEQPHGTFVFSYIGQEMPS